MQIVIDIGEHNKNVIDRFVNGEGFEVLPTPIVDDVIRAVRNGKPLPKEHGRLIDADKLNTRERGNNSQRTMWWNIDQIVRNAPTIIEADKTMRGEDDDNRESNGLEK